MKRSELISILAALAFTTGLTYSAKANDGIYPPAPAASQAISFDGKGFVINGQRTFIASGGMEYARVPRALWRDRLLRMKRAGFNCTETYIFWNFHEQKENQWNFSGDHDLNAYLQLVHQLGMYAIVRVGPYVCAEWDSGGYPIWLRFKPGVRPREDNQQFLDETYKYYDKVIPIIAANQINHGGSVILVQIENEYGGGWGTDHNSYEEKLRDKALSLGIEVPTFYSGLHHSSDPAGDTPWDDASRINPWFSTEFWTTWYDRYGPQDPDPTTRGTWKIIAFGGNGYNYYMAHGGTNFDYYNNDEDASSYDYGSSIGQGGDLRPLYYKVKEAALFAQTFQSVLENSVSGQPSVVATNLAVKSYVRTGPAGTITFLDNPTSSDLSTQVTTPQSVTEPTSPAIVPERKMLPVVENFALTPSIAIDRSVTQILTRVANGNNTTLIVYGPAGGSGSLSLSSTSNSVLTVDPTAGWSKSDANHGTIELNYPAAGAISTVVTCGKEHLRVLIMGEALAERTWTVQTAGGTDLIAGPDYIGDVSSTGNKLAVQAEFVNPTPSQVVEYAPDLTQSTLTTSQQIESLPATPALSDWSMHAVTEQAADLDDSNWLASDEPLFMGADGDTSAYAWYRTDISSTTTKRSYLTAETMRDRMIVFIDGQRIPDANITEKTAALDLTPGKHKLAIFTTHYGRTKLIGVTGLINTVDAKGLGGAITVSDSPRLSLTNWSSLPVQSTQPDLTSAPATTDAGWSAVNLGTDIFNHQPGWAWYQSVIPSSEFAGASIHFDCVDDNATVYCNGKQVGTHQGWNSGFDVDLSGAWAVGKENVITVLDQNTDGAGGISGSVTVSFVSPSTTLTGWKMRGGVGEPSTLKNWQPVTANGTPAFFQTHFTGAPPTATGAYPILRVHLGASSAGFIWLNGHNLGRYPEKIPVDGIYLPECWINKGDNTLTVFDENGLAPNDIKLYTENAASRFEYAFSKP